MTLPSLPIYPIPRTIEQNDGCLSISNILMGKILDFLIDAELPDEINGILDETIPPQGYSLRITLSGIHLAASERQGFFYGMKTICQLIFHHNNKLPCLTINDFPDIPVRGYLLDISRDKIPTQESLFSLVDTLSSLKYNQLQLYMEMAFAYKGYEALWEDKDPLCKDDIIALDIYCRQRGIELVANQNTFGHMERWLDHPLLAHLAEVSGGFRDPSGNYRNHRFSLNPTHPESLPFIENLMNQLLPNFSSSLVNINCDETFDIGQGCNRELNKTRGPGRLYIDFLKKLISIIHKHKRKALFWGDIIKHYPALVPELPDNIIALDWGYEEDYDFTASTAVYRQEGIPFYVCPGTSSWVSLTGRWHVAKKNIENAVSGALTNRAAGLLLTDWGDFGHHQQQIISYPAICYAAGLSWNSEGNKDKDLAIPVSNWFLKSTEPQWGEFLLKAALLNQATGMEFRDGAVTGSLLFNQMTNRMIKRLKSFSSQGLHQGMTQATSLLNEVMNIDPDREELRLYQRELQFSISLFLHACRLASHLDTAQTIEVWDLPEETRESLSLEIESFFTEYQSLWFHKNRKGGLKNSLERLEFLKGLYDHTERRIPPEEFSTKRKGA